MILERRSWKRVNWKKTFFYLIVHLEPVKDGEGWEDRYMQKIDEIAFDVDLSNFIYSYYYDVTKHASVLLNLKKDIKKLMNALIIDFAYMENWLKKADNIIADGLNKRRNEYGGSVSLHYSPYTKEIVWREEKFDPSYIVDICYDSFRNFLVNSGDKWKTMKKCEWCGLPYLPRKKSRFCRDSCRYKFHNAAKKKNILHG